MTMDAGAFYDKPRKKEGDYTDREAADKSSRAAAILRDPSSSPPPPKKEEARKDDSDKLRFDLIPVEAIEALAWVLTYGAKKYGERNWEKHGGMGWGRLFGAAMRHGWAWWRGEEKDPETGKSHLWHLLACVVMLVTYEMRNYGQDDRHVA